MMATGSAAATSAGGIASSAAARGGGASAAAAAAAGPGSSSSPSGGGSAPLFRAQAAGLVRTDAGGGGGNDGSSGPNPVLDVLRGACQRYETFERTEYGFAAPLAGGSSEAALRLYRHKPPKAPAASPFAPPPPQLWTLVHESAPLRGPLYAGLPATVREVAEANIYARDAPAFVEALGGRMDYAVQKNGNYYVCAHGGFEVQVLVYSVTALSRAGGGGGGGGAAAANLSGRHWVLEASADAPPERQIDAARALGSFAEGLLPHVELQRPAQ